MRGRLFLTSALLAALIGATQPPVASATVPSLQLLRTKGRTVTLSRTPGVPVALDLGVRLAPSGAAFELRAKRLSYSAPIDVTQVDASNPSRVVRDLPDDVLRNWFILDDLTELSLRRDGKVVRRVRFDSCLNRSPVRISGGPNAAVYPATCTAMPFTRGAVMGMSLGWGIDPTLGAALRIPDGMYDATMAITPRYRSLFGVSKRDAKVRFGLKVKTRRTVYSTSPIGGAAPTGVPPVDPDPDQSTLPDLQALPAWGVTAGISGGVDVLGFNATEWNAGPAPLVIEGVRIPSSDPPQMQAAQHFYEGGVPVGQDDDVGLLEYHAGGGHNHWHFQQFVTYELVDTSGNLVAPTTKMAWCLVPTDAIDLTVDGAVWHPGNTSLHSACGNSSSQTIREVLLAGHGDTYNQFVSGQSIVIAGVPNGDYRLKIVVNPAGVFHETNMTNNESFRDVTLGGTPGARTVVVAPVGDVTA